MIAPRWHDARAGRPAYYADVVGHRAFVEMTVRSHRAHGLVGSEYQASLDGVRLGEFDTLDRAQRAAIDAAQTKTPTRREPRGRDSVGTQFDY